MLEALVWLVVVAALGVLVWRTRGRPVRRVGSAAVGSIYGMLNEDKRKAVEIVVEGRAGARDPEDAEGNLPDLEDPGRAASRAPVGAVFGARKRTRSSGCGEASIAPRRPGPPGVPMNPIVESIAGEFRRYKTLAERAFEQVPDAQFSVAGPAGGNSLAIVCWHVSGNLRSRFTEFLTADGEKPWRHRDEEFEARTVSRADLLAKWEQGWTVLLDTLQNLKDSDLDRTVTIRGQTLRVHEALHRSLAHTAYHVGQIVYLAKALRGDDWTYLSIAPGRSDEFTRQLREGPPSEAEDDAGRRKA